MARRDCGQRRLGSVIEAAANVGIGWAVSFFANLAVLPAFGFPVTAGQAAGIGVAFAGVSFARSYALRRVFNLISERRKHNGKR